MTENFAPSPFIIAYNESSGWGENTRYVECGQDRLSKKIEELSKKCQIIGVYQRMKTGDFKSESDDARFAREKILRELRQLAYAEPPGTLRRQYLVEAEEILGKQ